MEFIKIGGYMLLNTSWTKITTTMGLGAVVQKYGLSKVLISYSDTTPTTEGILSVVSYSQETFAGTGGTEYIWAKAQKDEVWLAVTEIAASTGGGGSGLTPEQTVAIAVNTAKVGITPEQEAEIVVNTAKVAMTPEKAAEITVNTAKVGITPEQAAEIVVNTSKLAITPEQAAEIVVNTDKVGITPEQAAEIVVNTDKVGITPEQAAEIVVNTDKVGITPEQAAEIVVNTAKVAMTPEQAAEIVVNTDKVGITPEQAAEIVVNNDKVGITPEQAAEIVVNNDKVGITPEQAAEIVVNTDKVGITPEQAAEIVVNTNKVGITPEQAAEIVVNTNKVGITPEQAAEIVVNNDKVGITPEQAAEIVVNNDKVGITPEQAAEIVVNTAKIGFTPEQVEDVRDNTDARHSHLNKTVLDKFDEDTGQLTYNGVAVGGGEKGDTGPSFEVTETGPISEAKMLDVEANFISGSYIQVVTIDNRLDQTFRIALPSLSLRAIKYDGVSWSDMGQFTGDKGEKGDTGNTGETGPIGPDGIQGMQGNSFTVTSSGSLTESTISNAELSFLYSKQDPFIYVVTTDDRLDKTVPIDNGDLSLHAILYNGDEWADMGEFTGVAGETGEKGEKGDTGFTPAEAEDITNMQMALLGEYRVESGVSITLSLPNLYDIGSVVLETDNTDPDKFYLRYIHSVADRYVIYVNTLHYSGGGKAISTGEGVSNSTPSYQTAMGVMLQVGSWKRLTPLFSSEGYRYARINLTLVQESTDNSVGGTLYDYEILLLTSRNTVDENDVVLEDIIQVYGKRK
jgi:uncharacterized protein YpmB